MSLQRLEMDAYKAVLRVMAATQLDWSKERLLTDLRKMLNITNAQHGEFLEEVMADKEVERIRDEAQRGDEPFAEQQRQPKAKGASGSAAMQAYTPGFPQPQPPRRPGRPPSAHKATAVLPSPASGTPVGRVRSSGELGRSRSHTRDEGYRVPGGMKVNRSSAAGRGRGRGRKPNSVRDPSGYGARAALQEKVPFEPAAFEARLAAATPAQAAEMAAALRARLEAVDAHLALIARLDRENSASEDPMGYARLAVEEMRMARADVDRDLASLPSSDDEMEIM